jgi:hypothetical protein
VFCSHFRFSCIFEKCKRSYRQFITLIRKCYIEKLNKFLFILNFILIFLHIDFSTKYFHTSIFDWTILFLFNPLNKWLNILAQFYLMEASRTVNQMILLAQPMVE